MADRKEIIHTLDNALISLQSAKTYRTVSRQQYAVQHIEDAIGAIRDAKKALGSREPAKMVIQSEAEGKRDSIDTTN